MGKQKQFQETQCTPAYIQGTPALKSTVQLTDQYTTLYFTGNNSYVYINFYNI